MDGAAIRERINGETTETDATVLGWFVWSCCCSLAHSAGAHSVTRYPKEARAHRNRQGLVLSSSSANIGASTEEEAFPSDKPSQAHKHQLASSTPLFDHDRWRSCLALQLKHHRHLNILRASWLHPRPLTLHHGLGPRTCPVLGTMIMSKKRSNRNPFRPPILTPTRKHSITQTKRTTKLRLDHHHPRQLLPDNNRANVITTHALVVYVWRLSCPHTIRRQTRYQASCALDQASHTRTQMVVVYFALACARVVRNMSTSIVCKPGVCRILPQNVTTGSAQHVGTNIV